MRVAVRSAAALALCAVVWLTGCSPEAITGGAGGQQPQGSNPDPQQVDQVEAPKIGACRNLSPADVAQASNATETIDCSEPHSAQTYAVGSLPKRFEDSPYRSRELSAYAYETCNERFVKFLGGDESMAMRSILSWAWFRPSEEAWEDGARWYRCDLVGGGEHSKTYFALPEDAKGLLFGPPDDRWMVCALGPSVDSSAKVPCAQKHNWRAISTVKLGQPDEKYPGDRVIEVKTRDFCSDQVGAYLQYPVDYDFGYTWFHEAEWAAGNRRSVCWAKTDS